MIVRVNKYPIPGPPDLAKYGKDDKLSILGEPTDIERASWAIAIGLFVMRGGKT